jgi:hypothetical protein
MPTAYPTSPAFAYPLTRSLEFKTRIVTGTNGTEQRWSETAGLEYFDLMYPHLTLTERDILLSTFNAAKGAYTQDITWSLGAESFTGLYLDGDKITATERTANIWEVKTRLCQTARAPDTGTLASDLPALDSGARVQLPYTHERDFLTTAVQTEGGRFPWYNRASQRRFWTVGGPNLSDADAAALWEHFSRARGRWGAWTLTDPDSGSTYTARFDQDRADWRYVGVVQNALELRAVQIL